MKVFLTGATSLLGRTVALQLLERGDKVTAFQRRPSGLDTPEVLGDLRDAAAIASAARGHEGVIHLAALVAPRPSWVDAVAVNVDGTSAVLDAARGAERFVFISSPSVAFHGAPTTGGASGNVRYTGRDRYTASKAMAERLVLQRQEVPTVVIRPHLVWGPGDTQLVGRLVDRATTGRLRLIDHGRALIDTTFIDDAAAAIVAGLDAATPNSSAVGRAWTVTGNDPRPVGELIHGILDALGVDRALRSIPAPVARCLGAVLERVWLGDEPPLTSFAAQQMSLAHWFDQRAVHEALSWRPEVTVDAGLERLAAAQRH
jgi:nucleoside-diphosphate-sugar epimerase